MYKLTVIESTQFGQVRMFKDEYGEPLFCGADVAKALGYESPSAAVSTNCRDAVNRRIIDHLGRNQEMSLIPEQDVLCLIARSDHPVKQRFENCWFEEVMPVVLAAVNAVPGLINTPSRGG